MVRVIVDFHTKFYYIYYVQITYSMELSPSWEAAQLLKNFPKF
jgi:hypothetical protein